MPGQARVGDIADVLILRAARQDLATNHQERGRDNLSGSERVGGRHDHTWECSRRKLLELDRLIITWMSALFQAPTCSRISLPKALVATAGPRSRRGGEEEEIQAPERARRRRNFSLLRKRFSRDFISWEEFLSPSFEWLVASHASGPACGICWVGIPFARMGAGGRPEFCPFLTSPERLFRRVLTVKNMP